jgi:hypothetical protein
MSDQPKNDERFADGQADADPRTSDTLRTGVGAYDLNADNATVPADVPAVRSGDEDPPRAPSTPPSANTDLGDDILNRAQAESE